MAFWDHLLDVVRGGPHVAAHNEERHAINELIEERIETVFVNEDSELVLVKQSGQELNAGEVGGSSTFAELEDVDISNRVDGAFPAWNASTSKLEFVIPESPLPSQFRGDWQDPADTLLWSSDFSDPADCLLFDSSVNLLGVTPDWAQKPTRAATVTAGLTSNPSADFPWMMTEKSTTWSGRGNVLRISLAALPNVSGKWVSKVAFRHAQTSTNLERKIAHQNYGEWIALPSTNSWINAEYDVQGVNRFIYLSARPTVGGDLPGPLYVTDFRVYGAVDVADLYQLNDVVVYDAVYYRSLFNNNSDIPLGSLKWAAFEIP